MPNYIIRIKLITDIRPNNEFNNVPQRVLARESQEIFIWQDIFPRVKGGGEGGCRRWALCNAWGVYRPALQGAALRSVTGGWGVSSFPEKSVT